MPRRASLFGYCAKVRTPLRSPTTDVAVPPTFEPRQPPLVSWHFFLLAPQASVPISADHCLLTRTALPSLLQDTGRRSRCQMERRRSRRFRGLKSRRSLTDLNRLI